MNIEPAPRKYSIEERLQQFGDQAWQRLAPQFRAAGIMVLPARWALPAFKDERHLLLVVIAPTDLRSSPPPLSAAMPPGRNDFMRN